MTTLRFTSDQRQHAVDPDVLQGLVIDATMALRASLPRRLSDRDGMVFRNVRRQPPSMRAVAEMIQTAQRYGARPEDLRAFGDALHHFADLVSADAPVPTLDEAIEAATVAQASDDLSILRAAKTRCPAALLRLRDQTMQIISYSRTLTFAINRMLHRRAA